jgi:sugar phosphate isomerase/epimerase
MIKAVTSWKKRLGLSAHVRHKTIEEIAALAKESGIAYLEIVAERFWGLPDADGKHRWFEIREMLKRYRLRPLLHSTYIEINPASLNHRLRNAAVQQNLLCLELAEFIKAEYMVIHPGNLNRNYPVSFLPEARRLLLESLKTLARQAESAGVTIALENGWKGENHPIIANGDEHAELIEGVSSRYIKALFDIGHANTFDVKVEDYLERLKPHLAGIHLHDNAGTLDEHWPPGKGNIERTDFKRCFDAGVPVILELNSLNDIKVCLGYLDKALTEAS